VPNFSLRHSAVIASFALMGWALCAATMGIGMAIAQLQVALLIHALAAPVIFAVISTVYFERFGYTAALTTAVAFVTIVVFMDVVVIAALVLRSFDMFASALGMWIPFALIFSSTYLTGAIVHSRRRARHGL
jgi:hypothetical protein